VHREHGGNLGVDEQRVEWCATFGLHDATSGPQAGADGPIRLEHRHARTPALDVVRNLHHRGVDLGVLSKHPLDVLGVRDVAKAPLEHETDARTR
jgi:hypothetical protein